MTEGGEIRLTIRCCPATGIHIGVTDGDDQLDTQRFYKALNTHGVTLSVLEWEPFRDGR